MDVFVNLGSKAFVEVLQDIVLEVLDVVEIHEANLEVSGHSYLVAWNCSPALLVAFETLDFDILDNHLGILEAYLDPDHTCLVVDS